MWDGVFSPKLTKVVGRVKYVPLVDMTPRDWVWLDYDNVRTVAQNRIAQAILTGRLYGFFQVLLTEKAAKEEYFWPATPEEIMQFADEGGHGFFTNRAEVPESVFVEQLERLRSGVSLLPLWILVLIAKQVAKAIASDELQEQAEKVNEELLGELRPEDVDLLMSSILMWEYSLDEAEALLDDIPESDEVDEVRDWLSDRHMEIEQARRSLAASRKTSPEGLTHK